MDDLDWAAMAATDATLQRLSEESDGPAAASVSSTQFLASHLDRLIEFEFASGNPSRNASSADLSEPPATSASASASASPAVPVAQLRDLLRSRGPHDIAYISARNYFDTHRRENENEAEVEQILQELKPEVFSDVELQFWAAVCSNFHATGSRIPHYSVLMLRSGVPPPFRGLVWNAMAGNYSHVPGGSVSNDVRALLSLYEALAAENTPYVRIIARDLSRTFPQIQMFSMEDGPGQIALGKVLRAYSLYDPGVGYCQGLSFLVAPLLLHMSDSDAFVVLVRLMELNSNLRALFGLEMTGIRLWLFQFECILKKALPELHAHLEKYKVQNVYVSQWLLSLYAISAPLHILFRIFDLMLCEGAAETLLRAGLALLKCNESLLMEMKSDEQILQFLLSKAVWGRYQNRAELFIADMASFSYDIVSGEALADLQHKYNRRKAEIEKDSLADFGHYLDSDMTRMLNSDTASVVSEDAHVTSLFANVRGMFASKRAATETTASATCRQSSLSSDTAEESSLSSVATSSTMGHPALSPVSTNTNSTRLFGLFASSGNGDRPKPVHKTQKELLATISEQAREIADLTSIMEELKANHSAVVEQLQQEAAQVDEMRQLALQLSQPASEGLESESNETVSVSKDVLDRLLLLASGGSSGGSQVGLQADFQADLKPELAAELANSIAAASLN